MLLPRLSKENKAFTIKHYHHKPMINLVKNESGIALFLVLWVLTLLTVITGEFCYVMRTEAKVTLNFKEKTQAYYIARAGLSRGITEMIKSEALPHIEKSPDENKDEQLEIKWRFNTDIPAVSFAQGSYKVKIANEGGKININKADKRLLRMMLITFEIGDREKDVIVDSIIDWRDKNHFHALNGAEDDYYLALPEPYECKDGDFTTIEELLLVRGVTPEIFYGGLNDMVTVYKGYRAKIRRGRGRKHFNYNQININAAPPRMLRSLPLMTDDLVDAIVDYRKEQDFKSLTDLLAIVGADVYTQALQYLTLKKSYYFTVKSEGRLENSNIKEGLQAVVIIDKKLNKGYRIVQVVEGMEKYPILNEQHPDKEQRTAQKV